MAVQYLTAHYLVNSGDFRKARQVLIPLESTPGLRADLKARVSNLLARCYSRLGDKGMEKEAYIRALAANPNDVQAKLGLIDRMVKQGEIDDAIKEYRTLLKVAPKVSTPLAQQLISRNLMRPPAQRDWTEVNQVIDEAEKASPGTVEPLVLRTEALMAQDKRAEAGKEIERARTLFPKSVAVRCRTDEPHACREAV